MSCVLRSRTQQDVALALQENARDGPAAFADYSNVLKHAAEEEMVTPPPSYTITNTVRACVSCSYERASAEMCRPAPSLLRACARRAIAPVERRLRVAKAVGVPCTPHARTRARAHRRPRAH